VRLLGAAGSTLVVQDMQQRWDGRPCQPTVEVGVLDVADLNVVVWNMRSRWGG